MPDQSEEENRVIYFYRKGKGWFSREVVAPDNSPPEIKEWSFAETFRDSAILVAMVTGFLYFLGFSYYEGFYRELSLANAMPDHPTAFYITHAIKNFYALLSLILLLAGWRTLFIKPESRRSALNANQIPIVMLGILALWVLFVYDNRTYGLMFLGIFGVTIFASIMRISLKSLVDSSGMIGRLYYLIFAGFLFGIFFGTKGEYDAKRLADRRNQDVSTMTLVMKDHDSSLSNRPFLLIGTDGNSYILADGSSGSRTYIIVPFDNILYAEVANGWKDVEPTPTLVPSLSTPTALEDS